MFQPGGKEGERGVLWGEAGVAVQVMCCPRGEGVAAYYACYITSLPLRWSPANSPIVSELLHIITTNYPQQLNNLLLMHLGEYSGGSVEGGPLSWAVPARPFQFVSFLCVETNQNRLRHIPVH